jgi:dTDP-4-dehydrorhamnose reductase
MDKIRKANRILYIKALQPTYITDGKTNDALKLKLKSLLEEAGFAGRNEPLIKSWIEANTTVAALVNPPVNAPVNEPVNEPVNAPVNAPVNKPLKKTAFVKQTRSKIKKWKEACCNCRTNRRTYR